MKAKRYLELALLTIMSIVLAANALAACSDLSLEIAPSAFTQGDTNSKIKLKINPSGPPFDVWQDYVNATLSLPAELQNLTSAFKDLTASANPTESWNINPVSQGTYTANVTVYNSTGSCDLNISVPVNSNVQPDLAVSVEDWTTVYVNQAKNFTSNITNNGNGTAYDVDKQYTGTFLTENVIVGNISPNSTEDPSYYTKSITPDVCGNGKMITISAKNYHNGNEVPMTTISATDSFDVIGSEMLLLQNTISYSNSNPTTAQSTIISADVQNVGDINVTAGTVTFYYDNNPNNVIGTYQISNLNVNDTVTASVTWNSPPAGTKSVHVAFSALYECETNNIFDFPQTITVTQYNAPGGGGSQRTSTIKKRFEIELTKYGVSKELKKGDIVIFTFEDTPNRVVPHKVTVNEVYTDGVQITVESEPQVDIIDIGQTRKFDLNNDSIYDLAVKLNKIDLSTAKAELNFMLIKQAKPTFVPPEPVPVKTDAKTPETSTEGIEENKTEQQVTPPIEYVPPTNIDKVIEGIRSLGKDLGGFTHRNPYIVALIFVVLITMLVASKKDKKKKRKRKR